MRESDEALSSIIFRIVEFLPYCLLSVIADGDDDVLQASVNTLWEEFSD